MTQPSQHNWQRPSVRRAAVEKAATRRYLEERFGWFMGSPNWNVKLARTIMTTGFVGLFLGPALLVYGTSQLVSQNPIPSGTFQQTLPFLIVGMLILVFSSLAVGLMPKAIRRIIHNHTLDVEPDPDERERQLRLEARSFSYPVFAIIIFLIAFYFVCAQFIKKAATIGIVDPTMAEVWFFNINWSFAVYIFIILQQIYFQLPLLWLVWNVKPLSEEEED